VTLWEEPLPIVGRNGVAGPSILEVDGRLQPAFAVREMYRLIASLEAENLLNSTNPACTARNVQFRLGFLF
jgi:hypothetical protein